MAKVKQTFPVTKNGEFFGYADADQIAANPSLAIFDETKARTMKAQEQVVVAAKEQAKKAADLENAKASGADPSAVKKAPAK